MTKVNLLLLLSLICAGLFAQNTSADPDLFLKAVSLYSNQELSSADSLLTQLSSNYPEDDAVAYYKGLCDAALGNKESAENQLLKAYQIDTTNSSYLYSLTSFYSNTQRVDKLAYFGEKLLIKAPSYQNSPELLSQIADAQLMVGKDSLALKYYDRLMELIPDYPPALVSKLYIYRKKGDYINFFIILDQLIKNESIKPEFKSAYISDIVDNITPEFYWLWGETLQNIVDTNLELNPELPKAHSLQITFHLFKGEEDEAIKKSYELIELAKKLGDNQTIAESYSLIGDFAYKNGDKKLAYKSYDQALKAVPDYVVVLNNYAYYLSEERKNLRKALKMSTKVVELEPDNATYLDTHGWILHLLGRSAEAKPFFKHAMLYGGKNSAVVLEHYSKVLEKLGEKELASYYKSLSEQKQK